MSQQLKDITRQFAKSCIALLRAISSSNKLYWYIERQLLGSSISVAANYREANLAQLKEAFVARPSVVIEEADECIFWLELLLEKWLVSLEQCEPIIQEPKELTAIFVAARKTTVNRSINQ
ncbi:MAG: four helix bundle protein [Flavobacteriales bacterium]|nr:four helix bundle protein [Flavobacteriales bacterium]